MARPALSMLTAVVLAICAGQVFLHAAAQDGPRATDPGSATDGSDSVSSPGDARRDQVLARFAGGAVTVGQLEDAIANKAPFERKQLAESAAQTSLLRELVGYELLIQEAERRGFASDPVVQQRYALVLADALEERDFAVDPAGIPPDQVRARFQQRRDTMGLPRQRRASMIVVDDRQTATRLAATLGERDRGAFERAARQHNLDPATRSQGGKLGFFDEQGRRGPTGKGWDVDKRLVEVTFSTALGDISEPFEYAGGWAIIAVTGENDAVERDLEAMAPMLREALAEEAQEHALERFLARQLKASKPTVHPELLDDVQLPNPRPRRIPRGAPAAPRDPTAPARFVEPDGV